MKTLVFSENWSKLNDRLFTTLRKTCSLKQNEKIQVYIKPTNNRFFATVLYKSYQNLSSISDSLITYDTDTKTREEAIKVFQQFYHLPIIGENQFYLLIIEKEDC